MKKPRTLTGKIAHAGYRQNRTHLLTAKVPDDFRIGETFLVQVISVPICDGQCKKGKRPA